MKGYKDISLKQDEKLTWSSLTWKEKEKLFNSWSIVTLIANIL